MRGFLVAQGRRFADTCIWSWQGWAAAWASEASLRQWTAVHALSTLAACLLDLGAAERGLVIGLGFVLLAAELLNTAIEETVDHISTGESPRARKAKDCGSAAVALVAFAGGAAWLCILWG